MLPQKSLGVDGHEVSILYIKLNKYLDLASEELPQDPLPEMLRFRGINQTDIPSGSQNSTSESSPAQTDTSASIFRDHDIRGATREELSLKTINRIGQALAREAKKYQFNTIVIARDGRNSSIDLAQSLTEGIRSTGLNVLDLGKVPIPLLYFVTQHFDGKTGVMITGGNHPKQHTGLKIVVAGEILEAEKIQRLQRHVDNESLPLNEAGSLEENNTFVSEYIGMICEDICLSKPMKIVLDGGNGIAGPLASDLMQAIGCEVIGLYTDINESFPNHPPNPSKPENLTDLISAVRQHQADVGFAFDNEGAILGVVDSQGEIIQPDRLIMLLAKTILASQPNSQIIYDDQCPSHVAELIFQCSGRLLLYKAEPALMRAKLKVTTAKLAGDMNGRFYFHDRWFSFDDALYAASRILEILSSDPRSSSEVFAELLE